MISIIATLLTVRSPQEFEAWLIIKEVLLLTRTNRPEILALPLFCSIIIITYNPVLLHKGCFSADFTGAELNPALSVIPTTLGGIQLLPVFLFFTCTGLTTYAGLLPGSKASIQLRLVRQERLVRPSEGRKAQQVSRKSLLVSWT